MPNVNPGQGQVGIRLLRAQLDGAPEFPDGFLHAALFQELFAPGLVQGGGVGIVGQAQGDQFIGLGRHAHVPVNQPLKQPGVRQLRIEFHRLGKVRKGFLGATVIPVNNAQLVIGEGIVRIIFNGPLHD